MGLTEVRIGGMWYVCQIEWNAGTYVSEQYRKVLFAGKNCFSHVMLWDSSAMRLNMHPTHGGSISWSLFLTIPKKNPTNSSDTAGREKQREKGGGLPKLWETFPAISSPLFIVSFASMFRTACWSGLGNELRGRSPTQWSWTRRLSLADHVVFSWFSSRVMFLFRDSRRRWRRRDCCVGS